jgi:hypothetical protein
MTRFTRSSINELAPVLPGGQRIPVAFALDAVRGTSFVYDATVFAHNIALAASWNLDLARQQAMITGRELRICGYNIALAPAVDKYVLCNHSPHRVCIFLHVCSSGNMPLWGRHYETWVRCWKYQRENLSRKLIYKLCCIGHGNDGYFSIR